MKQGVQAGKQDTQQNNSAVESTSHREQMVVWENTAGKILDLFMSLKGTLEGWVYLGEKCSACQWAVLWGEGCGASGEQDEPLPHMNNELVLLE